MEGVDAAYFCWPVKPGLIHATVNFAQAAKEAGVSTIINLSQRSANRDSTSDACRDSFVKADLARRAPRRFPAVIPQTQAGRL
jgi:NAD(P)H dehydrogenase (quinone)